MKTYVKTLNGDTHSVDVESPSDIVNARKYLEKRGVSIAKEQPLIISYQGFKPEHELFGTKLPPIPKPQNADDMPPQTSEKILVATNPNERLYLRYDDSNDYVSVKDLQEAVKVFNGNISPSLPEYTLAYKRYWQMADFQRIEGPQTFDYSASTTEGMSETDSQTFSAELGVSVQGLSAKLSATFSRSITVSSESSVTHSYRIEVPAGKVGVWLLWQLIDEVVAVDGSDNQIEYRGRLIMTIPGTGLITHQISIASTGATQGTSGYDADITLFDQ